MRRRRPLHRFCVIALCALAASAGACATATGDVSGGELRKDFDPNAPPEVFTPPGPTEDSFADAGPTTWRGLYRDFFGRNAVSSCAAPGGCHAAAGQSGAGASSFICGDVDTCWQTMRTARHPRKNVALVEDTAIADPASAQLFKVVRFVRPDGALVTNESMPLTPSDFAFQPAQIERMQAWIRAGARND